MKTIYFNSGKKLEISNEIYIALLKALNDGTPIFQSFNEDGTDESTFLAINLQNIDYIK